MNLAQRFIAGWACDLWLSPGGKAEPQQPSLRDFAEAPPFPAINRWATATPSLRDDALTASMSRKSRMSPFGSMLLIVDQ